MKIPCPGCKKFYVNEEAEKPRMCNHCWTEICIAFGEYEEAEEYEEAKKYDEPVGVDISTQSL